MKFLVIAHSVFAVSVFRMQSPFAYGTGTGPAIEATQAKLIPETEAFGDSSALGNYLMPEKAFIVTLTCNGISRPACEQARTALNMAGQRIAQVINFKEPIRVNATFFPFCPDKGTCDGSSRLGQASPSCKYGNIQ